MRTWMCAAALAIGCVSAQGQEPYLIDDLDRRTPSDPDEAVRLGARFLFHAGIAGAEYGRELWVTDGSAAGTRLVRDINPGPASSVEDGGNQVAAGNVVFFAADDGASGQEPWVTDGTEEGTRLVRDIAPGSAGSVPLVFVLAGERCFFTADDGVNGRELWVTDGTDEGTRLVRDIAAGPSAGSPSEFVAWGDRLFFAADDGVHGREPWVSDGTEAGTFLLADVLSGANGSRPVWGCMFGERLCFVADDGDHGRQPWVTDGTAAGTRLLIDVSPFRVADLADEACRPYAHAGLLFFPGDNYPSDTALWCTDGTIEGTRLLRTFAYGTWVSTIPSLLGSIGERVLFYAGEGDSDRALWISDGTAEGTYPLADICRWGGRYPVVCAAAGDKIYFSGACEPYDTLWVSDGTPDGTLCLSPFMSAPEAFTPFGGKFYFSASEAGSGRELCVCDGTEAGTGMLKDIRPGRFGSACAVMGALDDALLLSADDGVRGQELWVSDGTAGGTTCLVDIVTADDITTSAGPFFVGAGDTAYIACSGIPGLWASDGTTEGTRLLLATDGIWPAAWRTDGGFFFHADSGTWYTDGTVEGTASLAEPVGEDYVYASHVADIGTQTLLVRETEAHGFEPWVFDRADGSMHLLKDIRPGPESGVGGELAPTVMFEGRLFFPADDGEHGGELWVTDGTEAGTHIVKDVNPGTAGSMYTRFLTTAGSLVLFAVDDAIHGPDLWVTDGTDAGTHLLLDLDGEPYLTLPCYRSNGGALATEIPPVIGGKVFFTAGGIVDASLWISDGTEAGTFPLTDPEIAFGYAMGIVNDRFVFTAADAAHGSEPWTSDGTAAGTHLLADITEGPESTNVGTYGIAAGTLFFWGEYAEYPLKYLWATDGTTGGTYRVVETVEPWVLIAAGDKLVFSRFDYGGAGFDAFDLWLSDGTPEGTRSLLSHTAVRYTPDFYYPYGYFPPVFLPARRLLLFPGNDGLKGSEPWALFIPPEPTPRFTMTPEGCQPSRTVTLDASPTTTPEGTAIASYAWDMGDGTTLEGARIEHTYAADASGVQRICLTVANDAGYAITRCRDFCIHNRFLRGDANASAALDIADAIFLLSHLFAQGPAPDCADAADANDDETLDIADAVKILGHLFASAGPLPPPFGSCGIEAAEDALDCRTFKPCES